MQKKKRWHKPKRKKPPGGLDKMMLTETFAKPVIISTYAGFRVAQKNLKVQQYDILVETPQGGSVTLPKDSCLFALPLEKWDAAKSHIKRRDAVKELDLGPEKFLASRRLVQSDLPRDKRPLKMRMRNGLVLYGHIVSQDRYNILMRVGGKIVLVFKHGVHEILDNEKEEAPQHEHQHRATSSPGRCPHDRKGAPRTASRDVAPFRYDVSSDRTH